MQRCRQGLVVSKKAENLPFQQKTKMAYALVGGQELFVKSGIALLRTRQLLGEEGEGLPRLADPLLKHAPVSEASVVKG